MSRSSSPNEKVSLSAERTSVTHPAPSNSKQSLFSRPKKTNSKSSFSLEKDGGTKEGDVHMEEEKDPVISPASFVSMFRFATRFELFLDLIAVTAAVAGGAAQPLMSVLFGELTQSFVDFEAVVKLSENHPGEVGYLEQILEAAASFRHSASKDALWLTILGIGMFVATYIYMTIFAYTGEINAKRVREAYLKAVLRQDIGFFDHVGAGEIATRIQTDTHLVQQGTSEKVALIISFISSFITAFILAYACSWRLALALTSILPCCAMSGGIANFFLSKYVQLSLKHVAKGGTVAEEVISTVRTAHAFGTQKVLADLYDKEIYEANRFDVKTAIWHGGSAATFSFAIYSSYSLAFNFGTTLLNRGLIDVSGVVNVFYAIVIGSFALAMLGPEMQAIANGRGAAAKLFATIDRVPKLDSACLEGSKPVDCAGDIEFKDVTFAYPSRPTVIVAKDLNLRFPAGKTTALVGASGSGKSTVISMIERFYDPLSGVVTLDSVDLKDLNIRWLRSQIGLVSQEPTLFSTSIRGNVAHGLIGTPYEHAPSEEKFKLIKEACIKANADGFISKLPSGYDTLVGERGFLLSGGQKQRIAIARAIVSDPRILLLDEATSALDTRSEGIVQDALNKASAGRTTITIAHRLSTVMGADCIYVIGGGRVIEKGTHEELLTLGGAYALLVATQKLREAQDGSNVSEEQDVEQIAKEEEPLGHRGSLSGYSVASDIIKERQKDAEAQGGDKEYSLYVLFKRMFAMNREVWVRYAIGACCAIGTGAVHPMVGFIYARSIEMFSYTDHALRRHYADRNALWFFIIAILATFFIAFQNFFFATAAANLSRKLRSSCFRAILRQDIEYFDDTKNSTGALTVNLSENAQKVHGLFGITLGAIVQSLSTLIIGYIFGLIFIWKVGLVGIACTPFLICTGYIRLRVVVLKGQANKRAHAESARLACEAASAIRTVASLTREDDCCAQYSHSLEGPRRESNRTALTSNALYAFSQAVSFWVISLVFWYGARLVSYREFSTFDFFVALVSTTFSTIQAGNIFSFVPDMSSAQVAGSDIFALLDSVPEIDADSTAGLHPQNITGHVTLENVHFRYPTRPAVRVLRGLTITVEPGTYVALVGASGCGKSTVIQLLERFYDPLAGTIKLDGHDIAQFNIQEYRKQIALVSQEPNLYAGTIKFNILLGAIKPADQVTQDELEEACRNANILDFIQSLPEGFETPVGGKGSQLSGGQKQRIAIARALIRNPKLLLLDEATAALDSNSEQVVQQALDQAAKGRTTIAIAHRLSTVQNADCIYFIKEGVVSEAGTHNQLLSKRGDYYEYVQLQGLSRRD